MSNTLQIILIFALAVILVAAEVIFARLRKQGRPRNGLEALVFLAVLGGMAVIVAVSTSQSAVWRNGNLDKARQNPLVQQVLDDMTLRVVEGDYTGQTDAEGNGIRSVYYEIAAGSEKPEGVRAQMPCMILELGVDENERPFVAGVTRVGRVKDEKWPDEGDPDAFKTICFWLRRNPNRVDYWTEGGVHERSMQEQATAYVYDVASGRFFWDNWVFSDSLGEKTTNVRDTKLKAKHFEEFMENLMK